MNETIQVVALIVNFLLGSFSLGVLLYFFIARTDRFLSAFHQKLAIGIFSVTVTTIVVMIGLVLPFKDLSQLHGKIGVVTFTLAGPPAIW